ncbi:ADP-ribosylation factor-like protein 13B isoform X2 [Maniola jurtina]|uniref:ADP-ribosylation factor-like protein 13B isoform X1 n=1 Tax=Maniola jurtina TaxID=191418 RepID=UPI001E687D89|nr:ADP-ribosylation factor-like protein 13B isoform X1 [Maniola jurtina]XP_045780876.1 ADP-ribosylation factor-like protein 13B isoform X2 [Maniola jurtina]
MGNCFGFRRRHIRRHIVLILIGLDNAGKTKTVNNLAGEKDDKVLPTVGFKAVNLIHKDTPVTIYDLGGGPHFRQIWPQYYSEVHGVIFVIDSSDFARLEECKSVLEEVLSHDKISGKPVLVLANKQDKSGALDDIDVVEKLNIEPLVNRYRCPTLVESYSATPDVNSKKPKIDPGLRKGYHWLLNYIVKRYGDINLRVQTDIHAELERRKRMMNRASNRASQTFTAVSDDIATQTGFENPNYDIQKTNPESSKTSEDLDKGLIHVKPVKKPNSLDSTITVESVEDSDQTSGAKPKLSPLFGRASNTSTIETVRIELEPRNEFRKLSPIVRKKSGVINVDFKNRPQSSPTHVRNKLSQSSKNSSIEEEPMDKTRTWDPARDLKHRVLVNDVELAQMHREIVLTERDHTSKATSSDIVAGANTLPQSVRPASASQLLRRQLELCPTPHKRRLSLRYMQRNKTSPERNTMLLYEPKAQRHLDKGDFEQSATIN